MIFLFRAFCGRSRVWTCQQSLTRVDIGFRIVGRRCVDDDGGEGAIPDDVATIASASLAAAAAAGVAQSEGGRDNFRSEVPVPEVWKILLAELLDVQAFQIRVRLVTALSVPVLRSRQQVVPLDLQSYQEDPSGTGGHAEQALLVQRNARFTIHQLDT